MTEGARRHRARCREDMKSIAVAVVAHAVAHSSARGALLMLRGGAGRGSRGAGYLHTVAVHDFFLGS